MTELSFCEQTQNVGTYTKTEETASEDEGYCEKHVTIDDDDLPVVYKPKSYNIPDDLDDSLSYELTIHQHPALKFSTSCTDIDISEILQSKNRKDGTPTCSPFMTRRNKIVSFRTSPSIPLAGRKKWKNKDISRNRGKTYPPYVVGNSENNDNNKESDKNVTVKQNTSRNSSTTNTKSSTTSGAPRWLHYLKKMNPLSKLKTKDGNRRKRRISGSFHDLPPIRVSVSMDDLEDVTNNNSENQSRTNEDSYLFTQTKSYRPTSDGIRNSKPLGDDDVGRSVSLKRVSSLPIL